MSALAGLIWASPLRDVTGFFKRYAVLASLVVLVGIGGAIAGDQLDLYSFEGWWHTASARGTYFYGTVCNFVIAARWILFALLLMEMATIIGLLIAAFRHRPKKPEGRPLATPETALMRTVSKYVAITSGLSFCHLGLYAMAFHYNDACTGERLMFRFPNDYVALMAMSILYVVGSILLIGCCLVGLRRYLVGNGST